MHHKLANALTYLDIGEVSLLNEQGEPIRKITRKEHAVALFTYWDMAVYLSLEVLRKAIDYLARAKAFACSPEELMTHFEKVLARPHQKGGLDIDIFLQELSDTPYLEVADIIDLIVFIQQTAFDRNFGVERDRLQVKPWLEQHQESFLTLATTMGIVTPKPPAHSAYCGAAIMGGAYPRVITRINYFNQLLVQTGPVWANSGGRELSIGLEPEKIMREMAQVLEVPFELVEKGEGAAKRTYLNGVTETMMVNYLLKEMCPNKQIVGIESDVQEGHWRTTAAQGAKDIAKVIVNEIKQGELLPGADGIYYFMIIAEQPYSERMARQVQRAFNAELKVQNMSSSVKLVVEGVGPAIQYEPSELLKILPSLNSELGALMAERYNDACLLLRENNPDLTLRDPGILMFSTRDKVFTQLQQESQWDNVPQI